METRQRNTKINPVAFAGMQFDIVGNMLKNELEVPSKITNRKKKTIIENAILLHTEITIESIRSKIRERPIVEARQLYSYFLKNFTNYSLTDIGRLSLRGHATVIHSIKSINNLMETDEDFKDLSEAIRKEIEVRISEELKVIV